MMEENLAATLGGTLAVPSVQELAKDSPEKVPARYVRDDQDFSPIKSSTCISFCDNIPIINMESLLLGDEIELKKLDSACKDGGFFQLINHGVSSSLVEKVKKDTQDFFNLPMDQKKKWKQVDGDLDGFGQAFVVSEEQKLDWADLFFLTTLPPFLRKQHIFPHLPLPFRETVELYSAELKTLALKIINFIAKALNMDEEYMRELFGEGMQTMRMNYYPPCPEPEKVIGLSPHSDAVGLTILLQLNQMEGLQIKKDGLWIPISPLPNAFIINIGDILEIVTNGTYPSIEHRATVNNEKERLSIATFYNPKLEGLIGPAPSIISSENPAKFKNIGVADYFRGLFARKLDKKSYLDVMRI
ncbi:PREDICTED: protein SRG1-like isoform X2 [Nicotiana attenuata]|uniref:Protein srg1 n=1 Tax=Nicotiana attenuata TaxID=49451 RepID=A0A1J6LBG0_NICAT|nr:PREDICTED: protein SRG1-like isoform X2 [Nicotiana attenuata]OIT28337.1 protein srg1 [Nicotiana attenuata]